MSIFWYLNLDHKTSHKGHLFKIEIYTCYDMTIFPEIQLFENLESEGAKKNYLYLVQMKF